MPFSYGSSYGSLGSHGSYAGNAGLASSYGSYGDVNNANMYYSPLGPSGFSHVSSSPDIRLRPRLSYDRGIRLSPGSMGPMSLGASPSQFTPPNYPMHTPANSTGKHGSGSPASGGIHGSPLGKATPVGQYSKRKNMPMPPHEYASQHDKDDMEMVSVLVIRMPIFTDMLATLSTHYLVLVILVGDHK